MLKILIVKTASMSACRKCAALKWYIIYLLSCACACACACKHNMMRSVYCIRKTYFHQKKKRKKHIVISVYIPCTFYRSKTKICRQLNFLSLNIVICLETLFGCAFDCNIDIKSMVFVLHCMPCSSPFKWYYN